MQQSQTNPKLELDALTNAYIITAGLLAAHQLGLFRALVSSPYTLTDLAQALGIPNQDRLRPLLLLLEEYGLLYETDGVFFPTGLARDLTDRGQPYGEMLGLIADQYLPAFFNLAQSIRSGQTGFELAHGRSVWMERAENSARGEAFQKWLDLETRGTAKEIAEQFEWGRYSSVVDLGGGWGALAEAIKTRFPGVRVALFENPQVCVSLPKSGLLANPIGNNPQKSNPAYVVVIDEVIPGDFFVELPSSYEAYILKSVLHDWPDFDCERLLSRLASQLRPEQRVIIIERCLNSLGANQCQLDEGGNPEARRALANLSLTMFVVHGARERSRSEWEELFQRTRFCLDKQQELDSGFTIFELKASPTPSF